MFDIGWMELLLIGIVALIVVGPKDLPRMFRTVGQVMGKARGMAREFQRSMEQAADESGLNEAARDLKAVNRLNLNTSTNSARKYAERLVTGEDGKPKAGKGAASAAAGTPASAEPAAPPAPPAAPAAPATENAAPEPDGGGSARP